jgi:two-component system response regulator NreC
MINILIVDDHVLFRAGLASLIKAQPDFNVLGEAGTMQEAVTMAFALKPDLILMDFNLPDGTGLDATKTILQKRPDTQIVLLTMHEDDDRLFAAIRSGAKGYLNKNLPVAKLLASLRGLELGQAAISRVMTSRILNEFSKMEKPENSDDQVFDQLTRRELEVLQELANGSTNREIGDKLYITENTVKNHVHNILDKLNLDNRREIIKLAQNHGLKK